eukprot:1158479-Pelagomonas_calceolata.AAC.3
MARKASEAPTDLWTWHHHARRWSTHSSSRPSQALGQSCGHVEHGHVGILKCSLLVLYRKLFASTHAFV